MTLLRRSPLASPFGRRSKIANVIRNYLGSLQIGVRKKQGKNLFFPLINTEQVPLITNYPSGDTRSDAGVPTNAVASVGKPSSCARQFITSGNTRTYCSLSHELRISNYSVNSPY